MNLPEDITPEELSILGAIAARLYLKLEDPIDKFILATHYELGYSKTDVAVALGISVPAITVRDKKIKRILQNVDPKINTESEVKEYRDAEYIRVKKILDDLIDHCDTFMRDKNEVGRFKEALKALAESYNSSRLKQGVSI